MSEPVEAWVSLFSEIFLSPYMAHDCLKPTTRVPPAVYGQAVTHTAPSRAGMVQPLLICVTRYAFGFI